MAQKDDLAAQLALMNKINAVVQSIAGNQRAVEKAVAAQSDFAAKMLSMMQQMQGLDLDQKFNNINTVLAAAQAHLASFDNNPFKQVEAGASAAGDEFETMAKKLSKTGKQAGVFGIAMLGLRKGFSNFIGVGQSVVGLLTTVASTMLNVGAAILAIPLKIFSGFVNLAVGAQTGMLALRQEIELVRKHFGDLGGPGSAAILVANRSLKGFSDTGLGAFSVFGTLAERLAFIRETAAAMGATFSVLNGEFVENSGAILAYQKGLGVANEEMQALGQRSLVTGSTLTSTLNSIAKQSLALGKQFNLDQKLIGRSISKAAADVKHFGAVSVKEIGVAAVYARKLGVELDKIVGTLDAFETFDSAAENASKLSQAFGVQVDAFKLMAAQNPAEQIEMLREQFKSAGVDASTFNRQQLKLLSTTTGLDDATAQSVFSAKNYGVSLKDVEKNAASAERQQLTQAQAMEKLANSIERLPKQGMPLIGSFWQMFVRGFKQGIQWSQPFQRVIRNIQQSLRITEGIGRDFGRMLVEFFPGAKQALKGIGDLFDPKKFRQLRSALDPLFKSLVTGKSTFKEFSTSVTGVFANLFNSDAGPLKSAAEGFKKFFVKIAQLIGESLPWIGERMAGLFTGITDVLTGKTKLRGIDTSGAKTFWQSISAPIITGAVGAWDKIKGPLNDLVSVMLKRLVEALTSPAAITAYKAIAGAFVTSIMGSMTSSLLQAAAWKGVSSALSAGAGMLWKTDAVQGALKSTGSSIASTLLSKFSLGFTPIALAAAAAGIGYAIGTMLNDYLGLDKIISDFVSKHTDAGKAVTASRAKLEVPKGAVGYAHGFYEENGELKGGDGDKETEARLRKMIANRGKTKSRTEEDLQKQATNPKGPHVIEMPAIELKVPTKGAALKEAIDPALENIGDTLRRQAAQMKIAQGALTDIKRGEPALTAAINDGAVQRSFDAFGTISNAAKKLDSMLAGTTTFANLSAITDQLPKVTRSIERGGFKTGIDAVKKITGMVQALDNALASTPTVDIATKLGKFAAGSGLGSAAQYTVRSKEVVINLNLNVTMDVGQIEKIMVMRKESIIRDRLEFATVTNPGRQGNNSIPESYADTVPNITKR